MFREEHRRFGKKIERLKGLRRVVLSNTRLIVTFDVDLGYFGDWSAPSSQFFKGVTDVVPNQMDPLFQRFGIRPTYLLSPAVMTHIESCEVLRGLDSCELGTCLNGDYVVPQIKGRYFDEPTTKVNAMQWEYPPELEKAKLEVLTQLFKQQFGYQPRSFRAGGFGAGHYTGRWLAELGYLVDSSVTPDLVWAGHGGTAFPDYRSLPEMPYSISYEGDIWLPGDSTLLEVPITLLSPKELALEGTDPIWFRPWFSDADTLIHIARYVDDMNRQTGHARPLVMMLHSQDLVPGAYVNKGANMSVKLYLDRLQRLFAFTESTGIKSCTLHEYYLETMRSGAYDPRALQHSESAPVEIVLPSTSTCVPRSATKPRVLLIADVPNWIFERHCQIIKEKLQDEFEFTLKYRGEPYEEGAYDLIYPLEWNLVHPSQIQEPKKYVTGIRSHLSWDTLDFADFVAYLSQHFSRVHVVSKKLKEVFIGHVGVLDYVTHGVDTEFFSPPANSGSDGSHSVLRVGWAGNRQSLAKGFKEFIEPLSDLPGLELVFCGYSDTNLSFEQMRDFYASIDVYVCSSATEGNNNSLLEAASMGRAIITTAVGTVGEYLEHEKSALIVPRELPAFVDAIERLRDDQSLRQSLGAAARQAVLQFGDWTRMIKDYRRMFWSALEGAECGSGLSFSSSRKYNILGYAKGDQCLEFLLRSYLEAFTSEDSVSLHLVSDEAPESFHRRVLEWLESKGYEPSIIPDIELYPITMTETTLPVFLRGVDLVVGASVAVDAARRQGLPAMERPLPQMLSQARDVFPGLDWQNVAPATLEPSRRYYLLALNAAWEHALSNYLSLPIAPDQTLAILVPSGSAAEVYHFLIDWLRGRGKDPAAIPDLEVIEVSATTEVGLFRGADLSVDTGNPREQAIAAAVGLPSCFPTPQALNARFERPLSLS